MVQRLPPTKLMPTGSFSSLVMERSAWVGWPLTSLMPKISEFGKDVEIFILRPGGGACISTSSSACGKIVSDFSLCGLILGDIHLVPGH